jgi:hypothetical protein
MRKDEWDYSIVCCPSLATFGNEVIEGSRRQKCWNFQHFSDAGKNKL